MNEEEGELARQRRKKKELDQWVSEKKKAFADELIKDPSDPFECARLVFPDPKDMRYIIIASTSWVSDELVRERLMEITGSDKVDDPREISVEAQCKRYLEIYNTSENAKDQVLALSQIDKIKGFDKSSNSNVVINNNKVMVVPRALSNEEWEANAKRQQERITNGIVDERAVKNIELTSVETVVETEVSDD